MTNVTGAATRAERAVGALCLGILFVSAFALRAQAHDGHRHKPARGTGAEATVSVTTVAARPSDRPLIDQMGRTVRLDTLIAGHAVAIVSFVYTNCQSQCPVSVDQVSRASEILKAEGVALLNISISVDPANDTPEALAVKASGDWKAEPGHIFLTGAPDSVRAALGSLGVSTGLKEDHREPLLVKTPRHADFDLFGNGATGKELADHIRLMLATPRRQR